MTTIAEITGRCVYDSHAGRAVEFCLRSTDGRAAYAAPSRGETLSAYEDRVEGAGVVDADLLRRLNGLLCGPELDQTGVDTLLEAHIGGIGRNKCSAVSETFLGLNGVASRHPLIAGGCLPRLCCHIANGGWHAYTNLVLSDLPEYLFVTRGHEVHEVMQAHDALQRTVAERLAAAQTTTVADHRVHVLGARDNRAVIEFLLSVRSALGLDDDFDLYCDASAGDLVTDDAYHLSLTDDAHYNSDGFVELWIELVRDYGLVFCEDPLAEHDPAGVGPPRRSHPPRTSSETTTTPPMPTASGRAPSQATRPVSSSSRTRRAP